MSDYSRRNYREIATIFSSIRKIILEANFTNEVTMAKLNTLDLLIQQFSSLFQEDNFFFDKDKFTEAALYGKDTRL